MYKSKVKQFLFATDSLLQGLSICRICWYGAYRLYLLAFLYLIFFQGTLLAAEGGSSNYLPGNYGEYAVAIAPEPGWSYLNFNSFYSGKLNRAVLQGNVNIGIDTSSFFNTSALIYSPDEKILGGSFSAGAFIPIGYVTLDSNIEVNNSTILSANVHESNVGDISLMPFSWYSSTDNWHFNIYEFIIAPTGSYDIDNDINFSRNYWSFDTVFALTNLNLDNGREFSLAAGFMVNTENNDTQYRTGNEFHVDGMFNQFFSETFAVGLHFYLYKQVNADSGSGAILGDFKGESYGAGPSLLWVPWVGKQSFSITATWLHDFYASNRIESDYALITLVWQMDE